MNKENIFIHHAMNIGKKVIIINNKKYKVDGYCEKTNTVYEFDGCLFHGIKCIYHYNTLKKAHYLEFRNSLMSKAINIFFVIKIGI